LWRRKDEQEKGRVMESRSRNERRFSCIEFSAKSESIMAEAIELSGANPEAHPREELRSLMQSLLHDTKCKLSPSRSLSLSSGANVGKRKHSSGLCIPSSPHHFSIQSSKTSMTLGFIRVGGNWFFFVFSRRDFAIFWPQILQ
jgi:hypothetical protein